MEASRRREQHGGIAASRESKQNKKREILKGREDVSARTHQNSSEDGGADAVGHLKLSLLIGSGEVVVSPRAKHPGENRGEAKHTNCW